MALPFSNLAGLGVRLALGVALAAAAGCARPRAIMPPAGMVSLDADTPAPLAAASTRTKPAPPGPPDGAAAYLLHAGDELDIQVYREPELSGTFKIGAEGAIRHSLVGSVSLAGKTVAEAEKAFIKILAKDYLVNPRVIIKLLSTQSSQIVVMGEVAKPGVYPLPFGERMTLLEAIAGAGGFTELASPDRVRIVRKTPDGHQTTLKFRISDMLKGKGRQQDIPLEPNDVIMVPEVVF